MRWTLHIPITLTTANARVVNGAHAATAAIYRRHRDACALALTVAARNAGVPTFTETADAHFRYVRLVRLYTGRQRAWDSDNLVAACKALRDACQLPRNWRGRLIAGAAIVVDDSAKWSTWTYAQERAADGVARVRIEITETTGGEPERSK